MRSALLQELLDTLTLRDLRLRRRRGDEGQASVERLGEALDRLMASDGEASSIKLALDVFDLYRRLPEEGRLDFFRMVLEAYGPDPEKVDRAYQSYRDGRTPAAAQALFEACEPPRQRLLRRLNLPEGGTAELVRMRGDLLRLLREHPELGPVDADFRHLFGSWFNRGFLVLRRIDWHTSAAVLEKLMRYEAVHPIRGWDDLRRRLDPRDRRCFAFFHPALGEEPLIFLEVALTGGIPERVQSVLDADDPDIDAEQATTAAFFGISNCQDGLRGISFGNFLIKQVVSELKQELPNLQTFVTLSPVPGLRAWIDSKRRDPGLPEEVLDRLRVLDEPAWHDRHGADPELRDTVLRLAARYLLKERNESGLPIDPVARFHLVNGARVGRLNWLGDVSEKGLRNGLGLMVNYVYDLREIERNHERLVGTGVVAASSAVRRLLGRRGRSRQAAAPAVSGGGESR